MAGRYGRRYMKDEDFEEEDVWGVTEERENSSSSTSRKPINNSSSSSSLRHFSAPRMIPGSSSSSSSEASSKQFSAPVAIPDWSKIYGKSSNKKNKVLDDYGSCYDDECGYDIHDGDGNGDDDDDDVDGMVPPHEYLARKLARSQISSFSVYEGIGRTLKGRDLNKLRNAILTKTGFLE